METKRFIKWTLTSLYHALTMCVMIDPMEKYVITIKDQLCTITLESHSESHQQSKLSFMVTFYFIMQIILLHYTLYKLLVQVLLLEVHEYNYSNTGCFGTLVGSCYTTTLSTTTIMVVCNIHQGFIREGGGGGTGIPPPPPPPPKKKKKS